ncbi:unnamed protein product, partial [Polarella glacialis]
ADYLGLQPALVQGWTSAPSVLLNESHADTLGNGWVAVDSSGHLDATLIGFGTQAVTQGCVDSCVASISQLGPGWKQGILGFFDVSQGYGCSPFAVPGLVGFLTEHGARFSRIAVVARGAPLHISQLVAKAAKFRRIRFFASAEEARRWLNRL